MIHNISYFKTSHLAIAVISLITGIIFTPYASHAILLAMMILIYVLNKKNDSFLYLIIGIIFFLCGAIRYYQQKDLYFSDILFLHKKCSIQGTVLTVDTNQNSNEQTSRIEFAIDTITINNKSYSVRKNIYIFVPVWQKIWVIPYQKISLENITLSHPKSLSYENYLIKEKIWAITHLPYFSYKTIQKPRELFLWYNTLCQAPLKTTGRYLSEQAHYLYLSIFCGKKIKSSTGTALKHLFSYWGLSHHLARSGLHLVLLLWILFFIFSFIPCSLIKKHIFIGGIIFIYYTTTFSSVAFLRSFCMYIGYVSCKGLNVPINTIHILLLVTLGIVWHNPYHIFFLDFQLSFSVTLLILWFFLKIEKLKTVAL
jgi:hypothetical protein